MDHFLPKTFLLLKTRRVYPVLQISNDVSLHRMIDAFEAAQKSRRPTDEDNEKRRGQAAVRIDSVAMRWGETVRAPVT